MKINASPNKISSMLCIALFAVFVQTGCKHAKSPADDKDLCLNEKGQKSSGCPIPKIGKVNLFIETSASMGGYFNGSTEFKKIISDLAVKVDKEIGSVKINFVSDTIVPYPANATKFTTTIATTPIAFARSSELHHIFGKIAKVTANGDISILVSDCILSFSNEEIKANTEINRQAAPSVLKNNIYSTFVDLKNRKQAASLYAFSSAYFGNYYSYQNVKTYLRGAERPFYVWVIGKSELLPIFDDKLTKIPNFEPQASLHFGLFDHKVDTYQILTQLGRKGSFKLIKAGGAASDLGIEELEVEPNQPIEFAAVVDLNKLPPYARTVDYLQKNRFIDTKGCTAEIEFSERSPSVTLENDTQAAQYEQSTHVIKVKIKDVRLTSATVRMSVPLKYDSWYQSWSTMDDRMVKILGKKTFAFEHLVNGVMEAYNNEGKNFIDLKFQINQ